MRRLKQATISLIFTSIFAFAIPASSYGQAVLKGTVVDESGAPVENVTVWIQTAAPKSGKGYL